MQSLIIFISLSLFMIGSYLLWPSRFNVMTHLNIGFVFISYFIPILILSYQRLFADNVVDLFLKIVFLGAVFYMIGMYLGFHFTKPKKTKFSFDVLTLVAYERRAIKITKILMWVCLLGLSLSYLIMGFVPMFASDPLTAKFFRGVYQQPYLRVAVLYRFSFYTLSTIIPISIVIWYRYRQSFFLYSTILGVFLMAVSLSRGPAFNGLLIGIAIIMSFKSKKHFVALIILILSSYFLSSFFYAISGVGSSYDEVAVNTWITIARSAPDFTDSLDFLRKFMDHPKWTYGRNVFGSFIPGHYEWNPAVYTLIISAENNDIDDLVSGGLRLPLPFWGYLSFQWIGVVIFSGFTGILNGIFLKYTKYWILNHSSIIIKTIIIVIYLTVFINMSYFYSIAMYYSLPPIIILSFYVYKFKFK